MTTTAQTTTFRPLAMAALSTALTLSGCGGGSDDNGGAAALPAEPASGIYVGFFYNTSAQTGGTVGSELEFPTGRVSGSWDFTEDDAEPAVLCGAGTDLSLSRTGNDVDGTFTSADPDPGCGFDAGRIFTIQGTFNNNYTHLQGTYGTTVDGSLGVYDIWRDGSLEVITCTGTVSIPIDGATPASTTAGVMAFYLGSRTLWGILGIQNRDINTGVPIACVTEGNAIGVRNPATGALEFKWIATGKTGDECTGTANGSSFFNATYADGNGISGTQVTADPINFSLNSCTRETVAATGSTADRAMRQVLTAHVRDQAR